MFYSELLCLVAFVDALVNFNYQKDKNKMSTRVKKDPPT